MVTTTRVLSSTIAKFQWQQLLPFPYLSLCLLISANVGAANITSINSLANISQIIQDEKGFIWLAGQQGLVRFDSEQSITFSTSNPSWPLPFNWLHDVAVDKEQLLLATETSGLWIFNPKTGQASKVPVNIPRKSHYHAISFQGDYFINAPDKLYRYSTKTNITELIASDLNITDLAHTNNHLYVTSQSGLYRLENNKLIKLLDESVLAFAQFPASIIAITDKSFTRYHDNGEQFTTYRNNSIFAATNEFNSNNFFTINTKGEISKFSGETLAPLPHNFGQASVVRANDFMHDNSGVLWVVSSQGIERLMESNIKNTPKIFDIDINANEIAVLSGEIIIGSYGAGLQNFTSNVIPAEINKAFSQKGLRVSDVRTISGKLYIGTFDGLWCYDPKLKVLQKLNFPNNNKLIISLKQVDNKLYIGTNYNGAYLYNLSSKKIVSHISPKQGLSSPEIIDILPLSNGDTWLATSSAIDIINNYTNNISAINLPGNSKIISLLEIDNKIFASTFGDGIYAFSKQGEILMHFGQGIRFSSMLPVGDEVWVAARPGLYRFNPNNYQLSMIENTEQFSFVGSTIVHNNTVYSSHYGGVLSLDLTPRASFNPKVYISKTTISGKPYLLNKTMRVASKYDVITLDLASLDYRSGAQKQFRYRINDSHWNKISGNQLTLTGLAPDQYHIEIMATNSLGQWSDFNAFTEINVDFPWYWTTEMRLLYGIFLFGMMLLFTWLLYLRSKSISYVHERLKNDITHCDKVNLQLKRNLSLVENLINQGEIEQSKPLISQCIKELNDTQSSSEPQTLNGKSLLVAIPFFANYLKHKYQVTLTYQLNITDEELSYELQSDLYRIIFEAITSVLLKGGGTNFKVILQVFKDKVWLNIYDDSQGFINFTNKVKFDISMYYIRQIATKHNGSINTFDEQDNGSQLVLSLPLS